MRIRNKKVNQLFIRKYSKIIAQEKILYLNAFEIKMTNTVI